MVKTIHKRFYLDKLGFYWLNLDTGKENFTTHTNKK